MPNKLPYREWTEEQKEKHRQSVRNFRAQNPEKLVEANKNWAEKRRLMYANDPVYREKILNNETRKEENRRNAGRRREETKAKVFNHYGRVCKCCGETRTEFLSLDHINNDGAAHRREVANGQEYGGSNQMYLWIIRNNFPDTFRTLCMNCNFSLGHSGYCPHEREREKEKLDTINLELLV